MKETNGQKQPERQGKPAKSGTGLGTVRVFFNPGPDAEDRLRRVFTILVKHATQNGFLPATDGELDAPEKGSVPRDEPGSDD